MVEVTQILKRVHEGDSKATEELLSVVYDELRRLAASKLSREKPGQTLQTTALVHEAYLRLVKPRSGERRESDISSPESETASSEWQSRGHFLAAAAEAMRRILVDNARSKLRLKRGGDRVRVEFDLGDYAIEPPSGDLIALDEALRRFESLHVEKAEVVKLRYFTGLSIRETAEVLQVSEPTVKRHWYFARAWLLREISKRET